MQQIAGAVSVLAVDEIPRHGFYFLIAFTLFFTLLLPLAACASDSLCTRLGKCIDGGLFETIKFGAEENFNLLAQTPGALDWAREHLGDGPYEHLVVYVLGARDKALRFIELQKCAFKYGYIESVEREIKSILGYLQESTDRYIQNLKQRYPNLRQFPPDHNE